AQRRGRPDHTYVRPRPSPRVVREVQLIPRDGHEYALLDAAIRRAPVGHHAGASTRLRRHARRHRRHGARLLPQHPRDGALEPPGGAHARGPRRGVGAPLRPRLGRLAHLIADNPRQRRLLAQLRTRVQARLALLRRAIRLVKAGRREAARVAAAGKADRRAMDAVRATAARMQRVERTLLQQRVRTAAAMTRIATVTFTVAAALAALLVAAMYSLLARFVAARDRADLERTRLLAREQAARAFAEVAAAAQGQSEERYRSLVAATSSVVWTSDPTGAFVVPQSSWEAYTGQLWQEHRGWGWLASFHPDDRERVRAEVTRAIAARAVYEVEARLWQAATGRHRHVVSRGVPVLAADGSVREWIGTIADVDEHRRAEE